MANPFLVLGGVAVGVITAGIGVLAVPGWIDSAHDSAAMNDLGNIRGAESAAILQLGEYTDDLGVLRSGELGVKFQKSDTVTLVGLKADSNESWCASVLSKSGRYFAASSDTARFATGRGAEGAMLQVGCDPDLIEAIITAPIDGADVGDPASEAPGEWVGGGGGGSNGGGASEPSTPGYEVAPIGASVTTTGMYGVAWTPHALYSLDQYSDDSRLIRSGSDGLPHAVTITGPAAGAAFDKNPGFDGDAAGNVYVVDTWDPAIEYSDALYRIAADGSSENLTPHWEYTGDSRPEMASIHAFAVNDAGTLYYIGKGPASGSSYGDDDRFVDGVFKRVTGNQYEMVAAAADYPEFQWGLDPYGMDVDDNGNIIFDNGSAGLYRMTPAGGLETLATSGIGSSTIAVNGSGSTVYLGSSGGIQKWTAGAGITSVVSSSESAVQWYSAWAFSVDRAGNLYFSDANGGCNVAAGPGDPGRTVPSCGGAVVKYDTAGKFTRIMSN